jgi:hypothetical protein
MSVAEKVRNAVRRDTVSAETAASYHEMLGVVQRIYDLTGQLDLKFILERAKAAAPPER